MRGTEKRGAPAARVDPPPCARQMEQLRRRATRGPLDGALDKCIRIVSGDLPRRLREPEAGYRIDVRFGLKVEEGKREPVRQFTGRQTGREFDLARRDSAEVNPPPVNAARGGA
jgi:hypothetical protein